MSITLVIYLLVPKSILSINFVPSIGNNVIDPIVPSSDSSEGYLENDKEVILMRNNLKNIARDAIDYEKCIEIDDRILCGYEKNKGLQDVGKIVDLGNGCRIRGDRMECNYNTPNVYNNDAVNNNLYRAMRQRPTGTPKPAISRRDDNIDSDILENKILKSAFDKFLAQSKTQNMPKSSVLIDRTITTKETTNQISTATEKVTSSTSKISQSSGTVTQYVDAATQSTKAVTQSTEAPTQATNAVTQSGVAATQSTKIVTHSSTEVNQSTGFTQNSKRVTQSTKYTHRTKSVHNKTTIETLTSHKESPKMYEDPELNDISSDRIIFRGAIAKTTTPTKILPILQRIVTNHTIPKSNILAAQNYEIVTKNTETGTPRAKTATQNVKGVVYSKETVTQNVKAKAVTHIIETVTQNSKAGTKSTGTVTQSATKATQNAKAVTQNTRSLTQRTIPVHNKTTTETSHVDLSKMYEDSMLNDILPVRKRFKREIAPSMIENYEAVANSMNLRQSNSENVTTACVENEDAIVCYNLIT